MLEIEKKIDQLLFANSSLDYKKKNINEIGSNHRLIIDSLCSLIVQLMMKTKYIRMAIISRDT